MSTPSDADRYADVKLDLTCPKCGSGGLIPFGQLDRMLVCYGCRGRFGLERQGLVELPPDRLQVHVRSHLSRWKGHEAILETRSAVYGHWLLDRGIEFVTHGWARWVLASLMFLLIGGSFAIGERSPPAKPALKIPDSLDGRAKMLTEALARRNMEVLIRLTNPSQHRALRIWLAHGSGIPQPVEDKEMDVRAEIVSTTFSSPKCDRADVRVRLLPDSAKPLLVDEQWAQLGEVWYFQPVRLRTASAVKGSVQPYSKKPRH